MDKDLYTSATDNLNIDEISPSKPPFGYYGAKQRIASSIINLFPPHNAWVEVFCGSSAITLAKKPALIEVINDLDNNIVNVFKQLRGNKSNLIEAIELTPYAREEFERVKIVDKSDSALERARKFLIVSMMTVNATVGDPKCGFSVSMSYSREGKEARVNRWNNLPERITKVVDRLKNIRIENKDAREIVKMFSDRPATLMYLDPPYYVDRSHNYVVDAKEKAFHEELLELCCKSKTMIIISHYENHLYRKVLNNSTGWISKTIKTHTRDTSGKDFERNEILWMNDQFVKAKNNNRVPIRLSKKEKENNKVNPVRNYM